MYNLQINITASPSERINNCFRFKEKNKILCLLYTNSVRIWKYRDIKIHCDINLEQKLLCKFEVINVIVKNEV